MKKYLISGIGPGSSGVGRLMYKLIEEANKHNYKILYKFANKSVRLLINEKKYFELLKELIFRSISSIYFNIKVLSIRNAEIILLHPQNLGIKNVKKLILFNKIIKWYIMDNSFFCMKSYNYLNGECIQCLNNIDDYDELCTPFPHPYNVEEYNEFLHFIKNNINKIKIYAQSESHQSLITFFYGDTINSTVVGLDTGEFNIDIIRENKNKIPEHKSIVFHGHLIDAKGFAFAYKLALKLPQYKFIFPAKQPKNISNVPDHIHFLDISWNKGLKKFVEEATLVLCLSMWSTPIEGALIKSIYYNGRVAVMNNQFGFNTEIADDLILKLSYDCKEAALQIDTYIKENIDSSNDLKKWLCEIFSNYNISKMFTDENKESIWENYFDF